MHLRMALVGVVLGSRSDAEAMEPALKVLEQLGIKYEVKILSAHRTPEKVRQYGLTAAERGLELIIAAAGKAAHLPGVLASWTTLPVIGVPLSSGKIKGVEALLSIVEMPKGVPVACVGIEAAENAAFLAAQILGLKHEEIRRAYQEYRRSLGEG